MWGEKPNLTATFLVVRISSSAFNEKFHDISLEPCPCCFRNQQCKYDMSMNFLCHAKPGEQYLTAKSQPSDSVPPATACKNEL